MKTISTLEVPPALAEALRASAKARKAFERMPPSHRREYIQWVTEAKKPETQARRAGKAVERIAEWARQHSEK